MITATLFVLVFCEILLNGLPYLPYCDCVFMRLSRIMVRLIAAHIAMLDLLAIFLAIHIDVLDLSQSFCVNARIVH